MKEIIFFDINFITDEKLLKFKPKDFKCSYYGCGINEFEFEKINCDNVEILSVFTGSKIDESCLNRFPNLKAIMTRSVGFSHINLEYCKNHNIKVYNTPHYGDYTVAEYAFGLLLCSVRNIRNSSIDVKNGTLRMEDYLGYELNGKTIGIIGIGAIGSCVAKIANGFSMNILGYDIYKDKEKEQKLNVKYTDINTLCSNADFIVLNAPLTKDTFHLFDKEKFSIMKNGVVIVNVARGEIINTQDLYNSLLNKKVAYAGIDVLEYEENILYRGFSSKVECEDCDCLKISLINHKLLDFENVIITPHIGFSTYEAVDRIINMTIENIFSYLNGSSKNQINA